MLINLNSRLKVEALCVGILCLVLLLVSMLEADEIRKLEADFNGDGRKEITSLVREINPKLSTEKNKFGRERLEIYYKDSKESPIFASQWFDYIDREEVIKAGGTIELVDRGKLPPAIAYIHTYTGVGSGGEIYKQKYYLYGWNETSYSLLFEEEIHNREEIYARYYTDEWQPGSYKEIIKQLDFVDLDKDGVKDIVVGTKQYEVPILQKTPNSKKIEIPERPSIKFLTKEKIDKFYWKEKNYLKK